MKAGATAMQHKIQQFRDAPFNPIPPLLEGGAWLLDGTCSLL
ncbi:MAG: hypothetical protein Q8O99_05150 [bacterium]|nr:hypothetical protein [bacterium]